MPEGEDEGLVDDAAGVEDTEGVGVAEVGVGVEVVSLEVEKEREEVEMVEEEDEEEEEVDVVDEDDEVVVSSDAPFSTVKTWLTASSPEESMISIS